MPASTAPSILKLKVTLQDIRPPIWRRLLVPETITLEFLHEAIQAAMGWTGGHLHAFDVLGRQYGDPTLLEDADNQARCRLNGLVKSGVKKFTYTYDFGDSWEHVIVVEGRETAVEGLAYPTCVTGKRNCPPEDCGGPWGYEELLEILKDPAHPEREERLEWLDTDDFDPEAFSVTDANARLAARFSSSAGRRRSRGS